MTTISLLQRSTNFLLEVPNISKLNSMFSPIFTIRNMQWRVFITKNVSDSTEYLAVHLFCHELFSWNCSRAASATFKLLTFNGDGNAFEKVLDPCIYDNTKRSYGIVQFIRWCDLFDADKNYVLDDKITFDINITVAPNQKNNSAILLNSVDKCCKNGGLATFRIVVCNMMNLMAVRSPAFRLRGLTWRLIVCKNHLGRLCINLSDRKKPKRFHCEMAMSIKLIPWKDDVKPIEHLMVASMNNDNHNAFSYAIPLPWNELINPDSGYIKYNSIRFEIEFLASTPNSERMACMASNPSKKNEHTKLACVICLQTIIDQEVSITLCGHLFCTSCITNSVRDFGRCPSCNKNITEAQVHRAYLPL